MGLLKWLGLRRPNTWEPPTIIDKLLFDSPLRWLMASLYSLILFLRGRPFHVPTDKPPIRVVCLSDTHDTILPPHKIPNGDLLIHCGDLTVDGSRRAIQRQLDWLASLPHRHKVFVCGNHDSWFDPNVRAKDDEQSLDFKGMVYLENSAVTLEFKGGRKLNLYGSGAVPDCGEGPDSNFAFQYDRRLHPWAGTVPDETDVLVTHTPPAYHRDLGGVGCTGLLEEVWRIKPKLHVFGHVHWGHGREPVYFDECQRAYESLMARPRKGGPLRDLLLPLSSGAAGAWRDAFAVLWYGLNSVIWKWVMLGPGSNNGGLFVNAAVMYGNTGRATHPVTVVDL
ncbi:calcineurin-like phosphoesterase [Apodospora peruviana]|uniref:Calcineurin-like phosphoesterase n=1 Tax=Apodospora peruviana TaxID=516989 RepID=A0AAE0I517_9PEZI|nr:calcineurin-like phosphoesterase [Apodospora peruviana]